ncbi:uncharacterized protein BBA_03320 [Beauveria bassiana ARSEF 2860]|uniref:Uncharacterized protein n=1 Tax=Beauveria bassiana (strain ARSEF 2860) TaxID=655819 RepID=J4WBR2_BEAB2|nr:uncharacterized protein BBA_03320 [Beauveria bassiana ARSEF 2860]EJP67540.1 hypothetical protein BBA_03320 [Beauveria bassiana ARSEF 2860]
MNHVANNLVLQDIRNVLGLQVVLDMPPTDVKVLQMQVEDAGSLGRLRLLCWVLDNLPDIFEPRATTMGVIRDMEVDASVLKLSTFTNIVFSFQASRNGPSDVATHGKRLVMENQMYCRIGLRSFDIGGMIGGIGNRKHFKGVKAAFSAVEGFGMGYGPVSDALAF